jgi:ferric-dicitrate binding protein FerR (iron transport regulator)
MNDAELTKLINECIAGDISREQHQVLQQELKSDRHARAVFREAMDLEASLRTWATEDAAAKTAAPGADRQRTSGHDGQQRRRRRPLAVLAIAASIALVVLAGWLLRARTDRSQQIAEKPHDPDTTTRVPLGTLRQQEGCVWDSADALTSGDRFSDGALSLRSGVVKLEFSSATDVVMEGPAELRIVSADTARLLAGNIVVNVTELSDGFTLRTPDATIIDEGTEYAVALNDESTEIHVFEGSVFWEPAASADLGAVERIEAGEARRYLRSKPSVGARIPLGMRKFVRSLEARERQTAGAHLLAYEGFENLAGRIRRGRSGFGWAGGWESGFQGRGKIADIVAAPDDTAFGMDRTGRRLLRLSDGDAIRRDLEQALPLEPGTAYFVSLLLERAAGESQSGRFFQVTLTDDDKRRGRRARPKTAFGITSDGFPFVKSGSTITQTAPRVEDEMVYLCVAKVLVSEEHKVETSLRVYEPGEPLDLSEPTVWTVVGGAGQSDASLLRIRLTVGTESIYDVDELKIGTTWQSVTATAGR